MPPLLSSGGRAAGAVTEAGWATLVAASGCAVAGTLAAVASVEERRVVGLPCLAW
jgi:hypothetical protein